MTDEDQPLAESDSDEANGIPIKNLWHMLLYAWDYAMFLDRWKAAADTAPSLDALLALVLSEAVAQRFRIGLGRGYRNDSRMLRGIKGRVDFAESLKRLAFENGQAHCRFQTYSHNVAKNQIIKSTMARLIRTGRFGPDRGKVRNITGKLRQLVRAFDDIDLCEPSLALIRRQNLGRNDADYHLMLNICAFLLRQWMPTEEAGAYSLPGLNRSQTQLYRVFERFVANFYKARLLGWPVRIQAKLDWHADVSSPYMPAMFPDVILCKPLTNETIILDTKYTAGSLVMNRWGTSGFDSSHLYQIYAYLRSQEHISNADHYASGILLYPTVSTELNETISVQGHRIYFRTVNLSVPWQQIESQLIEIVEDAARSPGIQPV